MTKQYSIFEARHDVLAHGQWMTTPELDAHNHAIATGHSVGYRICIDFKHNPFTCKLKLSHCKDCAFHVKFCEKIAEDIYCSVCTCSNCQKAFEEAMP